MKTVVLAAVLLLLSSHARAADKQIRPFIGATFGGSTTIVDPDLAVGKPKLSLGISTSALWNVFGVEAEVADAPGFFEGDKGLILSSRVTTVTGNIIVAMSRRLTEYSLRPYIVGGGGWMRIHYNDQLQVFNYSSSVPSIDVGVGAIGFLTNRVGLCWEVRRFQNVGGTDNNNGTTIGDERLSFWRATMALAYRY